MALLDFIFGPILERLDRIEAALLAIGGQLVTTQEALAALTQKVNEVATVDDSIITLVNGLAQQIRDLVAAGTIQPADLTALADQLEADNQKIRDAVTANTTPAP